MAKFVLATLAILVCFIGLNEAQDPCAIRCTDADEPACGFNSNEYQIFPNPCFLQLANCNTDNVVWQARPMPFCKASGCKLNILKKIKKALPKVISANLVIG